MKIKFAGYSIEITARKLQQRAGYTIDQEERRKQVQEITSSEFYIDLKEKAAAARAARCAR